MILLPLIAFLLLFLLLNRSDRPRVLQGEDWRRDFLLASSIWGLLVVVSTELASQLDSLRSGWIAIFWLIVTLLALLAVGRRVRVGLLPTPWSHLFRSTMGFEEVSILVGVGIVCSALLLVAWLSPANTMDALLYHMPRVLHWTQNANLEPYSTQYAAQLSYPVWPELAVLSLRLLSLNDQHANLIQWFSMVGSLVGVSGIVSILGGGRRTQILAMVFTLSIPMGILQATSVQTDYVVAFWLVTICYLVLVGQAQQLTRIEKLALGSAIGLGLLSKATAYVLVLPSMIWLFATWVKRSGWKRALQDFAPLALVGAILNLGYWGRNVVAFGNPLGPNDLVKANTILGNPANAIQSYPVALAKTVLVNFVTPWQSVNSTITVALDRAAGFFGANLVDYPSLWAWNHEDFAGNPLHVLVATYCFTALMVKRGPRADSSLGGYSLACLAGFLTYPLILSYSATQIGLRYQLPILVLFSPVVALLIHRRYGSRIVDFASSIFLLATIPWVLFNTSRPLIGMVDEPKGLEIGCIVGVSVLGCTHVGSVFEVPRQDLLFANTRDSQAPITAITDVTARLQCDQIGLRIDSNDPEYPYWFLLGAPGNGVRIESIYPVLELGRFLSPDFRPCAIICSVCGDRQRVHGLDLVGSSGEIRLYAGDDFQSDPEG